LIENYTLLIDKNQAQKLFSIINLFKKIKNEKITKIEFGIAPTWTRLCV
jgi:hypothetical protein